MRSRPAEGGEDNPDSPFSFLSLIGEDSVSWLRWKEKSSWERSPCDWTHTDTHTRAAKAGIAIQGFPKILESLKPPKNKEENAGWGWYHQQWCIMFSVKVSIIKSLRDVLLLSFGHFLNYLSPPPPLPQFGQLVQLFSDVEIQDLKVSVGLKITYMHFNTLNIYTT